MGLGDTYETERYKKLHFATWVGIIGNIILAIIKGVVGYIANSRALIADAAHSASDIITSVAVLIGVRAAKLPPDKDHPYGHGKAETVTAIIVAVVLFVVGFEIAIGAVGSFFEPIKTPNIIAIYAVVLSIIVKEGLFQYKNYLGKKYKSDAIMMDAWHHRSDAFSSIAVLIGIGAAVIGDYLGFSGFAYADPIAGLFVAFLIIRLAWKLGNEAIHNTLDHVLHDEDTKEMREKVRKVPGVMAIDEFLAREHGFYVIVDIKIAVSPTIPVEEGHAIGKEVKRTLLTNKDIRDARVHINPFYPYSEFKGEDDL